jgi:hypothetical protein
MNGCIVIFSTSKAPLLVRAKLLSDILRIQNEATRGSIPILVGCWGFDIDGRETRIMSTTKTHAGRKKPNAFAPLHSLNYSIGLIFGVSLLCFILLRGSGGKRKRSLFQRGTVDQGTMNVFDMTGKRRPMTKRFRAPKRAMKLFHVIVNSENVLF